MISRELELWIQCIWKTEIELTAVQKLVGGISSSVYRVELRNVASGGTKSFVLRAVLPTDGLNEDEGILAREAIVLKQLASINEAGLLNQQQCGAYDISRLAHGQSTLAARLCCNDSKDEVDRTLEASEKAAHIVRFPRCIAYDATGESSSVPALLMTDLQGQVSLPDAPTDQWLKELARAISTVHVPTANAAVVPWNYYRYAAERLHEHPAFSWSSYPERWKALIAYVSQPEPSYVPCLIHRDYHPTNVLWDEKQQHIIGIVDWVNGCVGPAAVDVGHCRSNLVQLYGLQAANTFLEAYMEANPSFQYDPFWDICCLIDMTNYGPVEVYEGWTVLGFQGLTAERIMQRIEQYVEDLVQLLHNNRYLK